MRFRSDTTGVSDGGQLLPYYRREKYPPGAKSPSVWDAEEEEPVRRLTEDKSDGGSAARKAAARIVANAYPGSPPGRMGPATVWDDHEYMDRAPNPLTPAVEDGEAALRKRRPNRDERAKRAARRLSG